MAILPFPQQLMYNRGWPSSLIEYFYQLHTLQVSNGGIPTYEVVQKFGRNNGVTTTFAPVCSGGAYQTPQVGSVTTLRVAAGGDANDTAAGTGAREITLIGLDSTGAQITDTLTTAGASASSASSESFLRLFRAYVSASGTYATSTAGSHAADITIENGSGGTTWGVLEGSTFARGQSTIAAYTVPLNKKLYIADIFVSVDAAKPADVLLVQRQNVLETAAPYTAMREVWEGDGIGGEVFLSPTVPWEFPALTDVGFFARTTAGTGEVSCSFTGLLMDA